MVQQLGVSLGVSVLVTVVAAAQGTTSATGLALDGGVRAELAHAVATALTGSAVLLALGLTVILAAAVRSPSPATTPALEVSR